LWKLIKTLFRYSGETQAEKAESDYIDGLITSSTRDDIVSGAARR
jgi:hypothetical protein